MPTYNQAGFIRRAILSLQNQTYKNWELIIVNDGCTDKTEKFLTDFLTDERIRYIKNEENQGLGYALNQGIEVAIHEYIAYLPSDDYYYPEHLQSLSKAISKSPDIILAYSGIRYENGDSFNPQIDEETTGFKSGVGLQLVQTIHRKTDDKWIERSEWVTSNLFDMFWRKLIDRGVFIATKQISCFWTSHPKQRHKITSESYGGGLNFYRNYYGVKTPIKIKDSNYKFVDEENMYARFRKKLPKTKDGLKILLVGELAYHPERIYALEEQGHSLYGLWTDDLVFSFSTIGYLPFGNVQNISKKNWQEEVRKIKPDIIYAMLNLGAVGFAHQVMKHCTDIPFVWHFKEGPHICIRRGIWDKLIELYSEADGKIYLNPEIKAWYEQYIPSSGLSFIMDGDLPKEDYFTNDFSPKLSASDGAIHTVIPGRIVGLNEIAMKMMTEQNIHLHLYTENYHASREFANKMLTEVAPKHFHIHSHCRPVDWVKEFSQYDAGWLHLFGSNNYGNLMKAGWNDLNIPARVGTLAAAGLPMILSDNTGHIVATQTLLRTLDIGIFFKDFKQLGKLLYNKDRMECLQNNILKHRKSFTFDNHVPELISFFRKVINEKQRKSK